MLKLSGKVALITGGASGLGRATARRLAAEGAHVVITDIQKKLGEDVAKEHGFTFLEQDVTQESHWSEVVLEVLSRHGGLHILVNNAGILSPDHATPTESRLVDWQKIFQVNVEGVFLGCRAAIPAIHRSGGGSIIIISSIAGIVATPFALAYGASKAAVRHMTKSIAQYCVERRLNIRCNSVHPGIVRTPPWDQGALERAAKRGVELEVILDEARAAVPMGSLTSAEDIAAAVLFLASEESRHMTGAKLVIDGGLVHCDTYHTGLVQDD